jgi:hypothetical protein
MNDRHDSRDLREAASGGARPGVQTPKPERPAGTPDGQRRDSPWSDDPGPGAGKTSGAPADYIPPGGEDVEAGGDDNRDALQRPRGGTPNVPRP